FIQENYNIFKVPEGVFQDAELCKQFSKIVTTVLCYIRSNIKSSLITSLVKSQSIVEVVKALSQSGMEVNAAHWIRFAFLGGQPANNESAVGEGDIDAEGEAENVDAEGVDDNIDDEEEPENSQFGLDGRPAKWTASKFWNFVDKTLNDVRKAVQKKTSSRTEYEKEMRSLMMSYFQCDLQEFPGGKAPPKLLKTSSPHWQTAIHDNLVW
ncbi:hypothetical protein BV22DRAFT_1024812, partial [Leucogyrophana mollusca]